jgi:hypothetical protein
MIYEPQSYFPSVGMALLNTLLCKVKSQTLAKFTWQAYSRFSKKTLRDIFVPEVTSKTLNNAPAVVHTLNGKGIK